MKACTAKLLIISFVFCLSSSGIETSAESLTVGEGKATRTTQRAIGRRKASGTYDSLRKRAIAELADYKRALEELEGIVGEARAEALEEERKLPELDDHLSDLRSVLYVVQENLRDTSRRVYPVGEKRYQRDIVEDGAEYWLEQYRQAWEDQSKRQRSIRSWEKISTQTRETIIRMRSQIYRAEAILKELDTRKRQANITLYVAEMGRDKCPDVLFLNSQTELTEVLNQLEVEVSKLERLIELRNPAPPIDTSEVLANKLNRY